MVFQQYSLYPHMTVKDNLAFPLRSPTLNFSEADIKSKVNEVAEVLQIKDKLKNRATALSGGEMQRVSIGRALVRNPSIYLMDEPLSSLDAKLRADLRLELKRIHAQVGSTLLCDARSDGGNDDGYPSWRTWYATRNLRQLVQFGTPAREIYEKPSSLYVASRLGLPRINTLPADLFSGAPQGAIKMGLRPEHILQGKGKLASVVRIEHLGDQTRLHLSYSSLEVFDIVTLTNSETTMDHMLRRWR